MLKQLTWEDITVKQFQQIHAVLQNTEVDLMDKQQQVVSIVYSLTPDQIDNLQLLDYKHKVLNTAFLLTAQEVPVRAVKSFKIKGRRFKINYDVSKLKARQYIEVSAYSENPIVNLHRLMASVLQPVTWWGKVKENNVKDHAALSEAVLESKFIYAYNAALFFCELYKRSIAALSPCFKAEMMEKGIAENQAHQVLMLLQQSMVGNTTLFRLKTSKA